MRRPLHLAAACAVALSLATGASAAGSATSIASCAARQGTVARSAAIVACMLTHRSPQTARAVRARTLATTVESSVANGATLSGAVTWTVRIAGSRVGRVDFVVDGAKRWTERDAPYQFNGDPTGKLDTMALATGGHTLTAIAYGGNGREVGRVASRVTVANTVVPAAPLPPAPPAAPAPPPSPAPAPAPSAGWARYGTANGWRLPFRTAADQDLEIGQDVALGAKYVRIDGAHDDIIQKLLANGITPVVLFGSNPTYPWSTTPQQLAADGAAAAAKWGDKILYECMNEVDIHGWTPDAYLPYLQAFHDAVKQAAPSATVLMDGLWTGSGSQALIPWTERFIALGGLNYTDFYNVHLYDDAAEHGSWSIWDMTFGSGGAGYYDAKNVRSLLNGWALANGRSPMPIVSTESGGPVPKYSEAKQATIVTNALHAADGVGLGYRRVVFTLIYNVLDDDVAGYGLLRADRTRRPAWDAFHAVATS